MAAGRRARSARNPEQVRVQQGQPLGPGAAGAAMADRYLFVTGKLAAPALRETLRRSELPFDYDVAVMRITVAALMTTEWIARFLDVPEAVTRIMIPGMCEGAIDVLSERFGIPAEKGPADVKRCPAGSGRQTRGRVTESATSAFSRRSTTFPTWTATASSSWPATTATPAQTSSTWGSRSTASGSTGPSVIAELRAAGFELSIDTLDPDEILMADEAGVQYVLSLNGSNRHLAERLAATPVLIPDTPEDLDSLDATIAHLERLAKPYLVDPIIEPIGSGSLRA